jgi:hypothetical protein
VKLIVVHVYSLSLFPSPKVTAGDRSSVQDTHYMLTGHLKPSVAQLSTPLPTPSFKVAAGDLSCAQSTHYVSTGHLKPSVVQLSTPLPTPSPKATTSNPVPPDPYHLHRLVCRMRYDVTCTEHHIPHYQQGTCICECAPRTCGYGEVQDLATCLCAPLCNYPLVYNNNINKCECTSNLIYDPSTKTCHCPGDGHLVWDSSSCRCVCPYQEQVFNEEQARCVCPQGYVETNNGCECPGDLQHDNHTNSCRCPLGMIHDPFVNECFCLVKGQEYNGKLRQCVCPGDKVVSDDGTSCVCPYEGQEFDQELVQCVCPPLCLPGFENKAIDGVCQCTCIVTCILPGRLDPEVCACVCPKGYNLTKDGCFCPGQLQYDVATDSCKCPPGLTHDPFVNECFCLVKGQEYNAKLQQCVCPGDKVVSDDGTSCVCPPCLPRFQISILDGQCICLCDVTCILPGRLDPEVCVCVCPEGFSLTKYGCFCPGQLQYDVETDSCKCPPGLTHDPFVNECFCLVKGQEYNAKLQQCVCPGGRQGGVG